MIGALLDDLVPHVTAADAVLKTDETVTVALGNGDGNRLERRAGMGCHLRVLKEGRVGMAGATGERWEDLRSAALESAAQGTREEIHFPDPAPVPEVQTADRVALTAGPAQVLELAQSVARRLDEVMGPIETWAERSSGRVEVANTRGVVVSYEVSLVGVGAVVGAAAGIMRPPLLLQWVGTSWPTGLDVEQLVSTIARRLSPPLLHRLPNTDPVQVHFGPRAVRALLRPLELALVGANVFDGSSPFHDREGEVVAPEALTLTDDPTVSYRPASRPVDDDGVVSRRHALIEGGRLRGWISDLASGGRLGIPSTGHARRQPHAPPRTAFTNLVVAPGEVASSDFLAEREGILIEDLPIPSGNVIDGRATFVTPWAYWVSDGERVGRLPTATIGGNVYDLLERLVAVGRETEWLGSWCGPAMLLDGIEVRVG